MKITHNLNNTLFSKDIRTSEDINFLITNKIGSYCLLGDSPVSRYQGVFMFSNSKMYRIIENILLPDAGEIKEIKNNFSYIERRRRNNHEKFFMPFGYEAVVYELEKKDKIDLVLDIRESYANPKFGREYRISRSKEKIIISYNDKSSGTRMYVAVRSDSENTKAPDRWIRREYSYDKERNTQPFEKYVYHALSLDAKNMVLAFSAKKKHAVEEADYVYNNLKRLKEHQKIYVSSISAKKTKDIETRMAKKCAISSLNKLTANIEGKKGVFAGLPWFFQFWSRDELISAKALLLNSQEKEVKEILLKNLNLLKKGIFPNITMPRSREKQVGLGNADSVGWLFKRLHDSLFLFTQKEKKMIEKKLKSSISCIEKNLVRQGLIYNSPRSTWMDSEWAGDNREGFRIEIQALYLNMLRLAYTLTKKQDYFDKEQQLREKVREKFWNKNMLADGLDDFTARPNVFIAAYLYPELLSKKEWTRCFDNIIPKLWLKWGGFSSIEKSHPLFTKDYTGETKQSYHRGDSWFWINNLAALVLYRTNKRKFGKYIKKIIKASSKEILFSGAIGHHAEVSSASSLKSKGCFSQAWSDAMFIEMIEEMS